MNYYRHFVTRLFFVLVIFSAILCSQKNDQEKDLVGPGNEIKALAAAASDTTDYRVIPEDGIRLMWNSDESQGYCGEASLQVAGLHMGFWVSEYQAYKMAGGEALLGVNYDKMLNKLHLTHSNYVNSGSSSTNRKNFISWIRDGLVAGNPVIFGVLTHASWHSQTDYDHIIPAHAVTGHATGYYGTDILRFQDLLVDDEMSYTFDEWRYGYQNSHQEYYLTTESYQYGTVITGMEGDSETIPITLTVDSQTEPWIEIGEPPVTMNGNVHMSDLTIGTVYSLLRWDATSSTISSVPFTNLLNSANSSNVEYTFTASADSAERSVQFMSDKIVIFRLVEGSIGGNPPSGTFEKRVTASSDDAEETTSSGSMSLTSTDLEMAEDSSPQRVGIRFTGVTIPQGAEITNAYIQFTTDETSSGTATLAIKGELTSNSSTFTTSSQNLSNRTRTNAVVTWSPADWNTVGESGVNQRTADISEIIQEIVDQSGWSSGNALTIIISHEGKRVAESYDGSPSQAPLLHVEY